MTVNKVSDDLQALIRYHNLTVSAEGWELVENVGKKSLLLPGQLELVPFLLERENYIKGEELVKRAKKMRANLGWRQAKFLLDHQGEILEEWRQYHLVFPGTIWIWRRRNCFRTIPWLWWNPVGKYWYLLFDWLNTGFTSDDRLLCPR